MRERNYSSCAVHDWWTGAADVPCPHCGKLNNLRAELRWCDAERRLALRALKRVRDEWPKCDCYGAKRRGRERMDGAKCLRCGYEETLSYVLDALDAAQIAAADEESGR